MTPVQEIIGGQIMSIDLDTRTLLAKDPNLVPTKDFDCPTLSIADDATTHVPVTTNINFTPLMLLVTADGSFNWSSGSGGSTFTQNVGPAYGANVGGQPYAIPCASGVLPKFCRSTNGGSTVNLYVKVLGA